MNKTSLENIWIESSQPIKLTSYLPHILTPTVLQSEEAVGHAMLNELEETARQLDLNPGLYIRLHSQARSFILPDVLAGEK